MRRKLTVALLLALIPFSAFIFSSILSVHSYQTMVDDLALSISKLPRRSELISTLSQLVRPLSVQFPDESKPDEVRQHAADVQTRLFKHEFVRAQERFDEFRDDWHQLPNELRQSSQEQIGFTATFASVDQGLALIEQDMDSLDDLENRDRAVHEMIRYTADMIDVVQRAPDPSNRLIERLHKAEASYRFYRWVLTVSAIVSVGAMTLLLVWGYQFIFVPIRKLQASVNLVSDGDYSAKLDAGTSCELSSLARAFNQMTDKIQRDAEDKEQQIKAASQQLVLTQRLSSASFLSSGVAHEINNPLNTIMNSAYGTLLDLDETFETMDQALAAEVRQALEVIQSEAERCAEITQKMLAFSHGKSEDYNSYEVTAIVDDVVSLVQHMSRYKNHSVTASYFQSVRAWVCGPEIKQVVLNLVANALDACGERGNVEVIVNDLDEWAEIQVRDNGSGMTSDQMQDIFQPFFTTKEVGKGTGLGLSIIHRIVLNHAGTIEVESDGPDTGSTFTVRLPKAPAKSKAA